MRADPIALWVVPVADLGGVARHTLDAVGAGIPGWRTIVLCPEGPLADGLRVLGRPVLAGEVGPQVGVRRSVQTLRHAIRSLRPTIVHTHLAYADIIAALALAPTRATGKGAWLDALPGSRPRLISTEHGIAPDDRVYHGTRGRSLVMARVHQARTLAFDRLIAVSESTRDVMVDKWHPRAPIEVILNGVDRSANVSAHAGLRVASISRLAPEKGLDRLVDAFAVVHRQRPEATLTIAGTGPVEAQLREQIDRLGLAGRVSLPGFMPAGDLLRASDVLVQLSTWENCSYSLLDACAAGLGVVATPVGGNPEILPARCIFRLDDLTVLANAIVTQGLVTASRPGLREGWPTVADMTRTLASSYARTVP